MTGRRWQDVKAEALARNPWLASDEAEQERESIRAEHVARIRGHELAELRKITGLTQAQVAEQLNLSQARISQIENGHIDSLELLRAYARVLGGEVSVMVQRGPLTIHVA